MARNRDGSKWPIHCSANLYSLFVVLAIVFPSSGHGILAFSAVAFALRLARHTAEARPRTENFGLLR
jgi:hypothetical protein